MVAGPMQFGANNNAGPNPPNQTTLRTQISNQATLLVRNEGPVAGYGLEAVGGNLGVIARAESVTADAFGLQAEAYTGILARSTGNGDGILARSPQRNGVRAESNGDGTAAGVSGISNGLNSNGVVGEANNGPNAWGVWGRSSSGLAGYFEGKVYVTDLLYKGGGGFRIDHPLDRENKYLSHSFVESPDMLNVYNGNVTTDDNGDASVMLPDYFEALNQDFRYQLTVIGQFAQAIVAEEIKNNQFTVKTDRPGVKVSWQITGVRKDPFANMYRVPVEEDKPADERQSYLHPEAYGKPEIQGVEYARGKGLKGGS